MDRCKPLLPLRYVAKCKRTGPFPGHKDTSVRLEVHMGRMGTGRLQTAWLFSCSLLAREFAAYCQFSDSGTVVLSCSPAPPSATSLHASYLHSVRTESAGTSLQYPDLVCRALCVSKAHCASRRGPYDSPKQPNAGGGWQQEQQQLLTGVSIFDVGSGRWQPVGRFGTTFTPGFFLVPHPPFHPVPILFLPLGIPLPPLPVGAGPLKGSPAAWPRPAGWAFALSGVVIAATHIVAAANTF